MNLQGRDLKLDLHGDDVALLHRELASIGLTITDAELRAMLFGQTTQEAILRFQKEHGLISTGIVDAATAHAINVAADSSNYAVKGNVVSWLRAGVGGLRVEIVDKSVGADLHLADAITAEDGSYQAGFNIAALKGKQKPDLQARVFSGRELIGVSDVSYNASNPETLNVLLTAKAAASLPSEHQTLTGALSAHFQGNLRDLKEDDQRQDITYLANKSGWDARAVALASLADQFSARTATAAGLAGIDPAFYYALFRAGIPANESALYQTSANAATAIWKQGIAQGIIPAALESSLPQVVASFQSLASQRALQAPALVGMSSLKDLVSVSLGDDAARQQQFADLYIQHADDPAELWKAVEAKLGVAAAARLKLDGQLGYLTLNNAPLIRKLHDAAGRAGVTNISSLAEGGYHRAEQWLALLADSAIPPEIEGADDKERRGRYADLLAAQVRLSFPTLVVAAMVKGGETPLRETVRDQVYAFLTEHQDKFEIGIHPVGQYIARNNLQVAPELTKEIARLQRVYQITPSDSAMNALLQEGLDSAYAVVRYGQDEFVKVFKGKLGGESNARTTYAKSQQVHNTALNIATSYLTASNAPQIGSNLGGFIVDPVPQPPTSADVIAYPTLEQLFGSMDFCTCEECRSILSPAAYLVDLLLFCDRPVNDQSNPQTELLNRRPDIQHLALTCENTNTPMPYIDLVNETLEYFVTNNLKLENYTGHDTGSDATPEELLATPQFVSDAAYATLAAELFPAPLPFHQPLENLRRYFDAFEAQLPDVMLALRKDDSVERGSPNEYGWRDILMEDLRFSRPEYDLLTDRTLTLQQVYGYAPETSEAEILTDLSNVKQFCRRIGISYEEIIEILRTRFINRNSALIPKLERLGVSFATLKALKDGTVTDDQFAALLPAGFDSSPYGGDVKAWLTDDQNFARVMSLITLANPDAAADLCDFGKLEFRYSNPDNDSNRLKAFDFVRLLRFIRLWRKLGWTIDQTDKAISSLYPPDQTPDTADDSTNRQRLDDGFLTLLPRLGLLKRIMDRLKLKTTRGLLPLLACFAPISADGSTSLYRQMFLSPALLKQDPAFGTDAFGGVLTDANQKLADHIETLRAAFLLTSDEFRQITDALGYGADAPMTLETVSAIFRRGWLARQLRVSVREFLLLSQFTGVDPFAPPDPPPPLLRFLDILARLRAVSMKPTEALYLLWNQDISGSSDPGMGQISNFARTLRLSLAAIESAFAVISDPDGQIGRSRMAMVYGNEATDLFFGLLGNTVVSQVLYTHPQSDLEQAILDTAPGQIAYDDFGKKLSYTGVLTPAKRDALKAIAIVTDSFRTAVDSLYDANQKVVGPFFARYPELAALYDTYVGSTDPEEKKRSDLLDSFLPELRRRRKRQQALQAASTELTSDEATAGTFLDDATVLHAATDNTRPALDDFVNLELGGPSVRFFFRDTATGPADEIHEAEASVMYSSISNPLPANPSAGNPISLTLSGYLEVPESGLYNLRIEADVGASVTLDLDGTSQPLAQAGGIWSNAGPIELRAGTLSPIAIQVERVTDALAVRWESTGQGWEVVPARYLYSAIRMDRLRSAYVRVLKLVSLMTRLLLTSRELAYLATHPDYRISGEGWSNQLTVVGSPDAVTSLALSKALIAALDFARIKADLSPDDERLVDILEDPVAAAQDDDKGLFTLTRWDSESLDILLARRGNNISDLYHFEVFCRVYDSFGLVRQTGIPASALLMAATNEPNATTIRNLQAALRARYDESNWLAVLKPINNAMRALQRDALVAYVLHYLRQKPETASIDTPDKLFEHFLMDVQMDPCMQTSRIRNALSSVQLFIERCLMNLEPSVSPSSINAQQWEWMKRYRVWQANREVFLYPENWLEPELRDDQSPFFKETMAELLQGDITEDRAASALLTYLGKLEEVAKLEPCGIYYLENDDGFSDDIAHVVARTPGANRKYFYRRREYGYWTPWEQVKLDIEDNPVLPVVWRGRLFLFWLKILRKAGSQASLPDKPLAEMQGSDIASPDELKTQVQALLCWSEYFDGKWQPTKTSDVNRPTLLGDFRITEGQKLTLVFGMFTGPVQAAPGSTGGAPPKPSLFDRSALVLSAAEAEDSLRIVMADQGGSWFHLYNTHSLPVRREDDLQDFVVVNLERSRQIVKSSGTLSIYYESAFKTLDPSGNFSGNALVRSVLKNGIDFRIIAPRHHLRDPWDAPFFFEDSRHVFYVSTSQALVAIHRWNDFGLKPTPSNQLKAIPPLIFQDDATIHLKSRLIPAELFRLGDPSIFDAGPVHRMVSEDAYITRAISTTAAVRFGDKQIGPMGGLPDDEH